MADNVPIPQDATVGFDQTNQPKQPASNDASGGTPIPQDATIGFGGSAANEASIGPAPEPGFFEQAKSVISNSPLGYALEKTLPKVSDALHIHPTETIYSPEYEAHHEQVLPMENLISPTTQNPTSRFLRGELNSLSNLGTMPNLTIMAATGALGLAEDSGSVAVVQRLISAGFGYKMIEGALGRYPQAKDAIERGDYASAAEIIGQSVTDIAVAGQAVKHAAGDVQGEQQGRIEADESTKALLKARGDERQANIVDAAKKMGRGNYFRPAHKTIAGVDVPITAASQENAPTVAKVAAKIATPGAAAEFAAGQTRPAATSAAVSSIGQMVADKVAAHSALRGDTTAPDKISGTDTPAPYNTIDDAQAALESGAKPTYQTADAIDAQERAAWEAQKKTAVEAHKTAIDAHNQQVGEANAEGESLDTIPFDETQADLPERPKFLSELRAAEDAAWHMAKNGNAEERAQAYEKDIPKAEKDTDNWFKQHESQIPATEYESAKDLTYRAKRLETVAASLRAPMLNNSVSSRTLNGVEAKIDNQAIRRGQAPGAFRRLMGEEGYQNWKSVVDVLKSPESVDPNKKPGTGDLTMGALAFSVSMLSHVWGGALGTLIPLKYATRFILDRALFNPEFGKWFVDNFNRFKTTGGKVSSDMVDSLHNMILKNPMSDKELHDAGFTTPEIASGMHTPIVGPGPKLSQGPAPTDGTNYAYRARNVGEKGVPIQNTHAQATLDPSQAAKYAEAGQRNPEAGEVVKVDLNKLKPEDYSVREHPDGQKWVKFNRPLDESELEMHQNADGTAVPKLSQRKPAKAKAPAAPAFEPEQVKSATGNFGAFDSKNPDIRLSEAPVSLADWDQYRESHPITQDHIERAFPGQDVQKIDDRNFIVKLDNGNNVRIHLQDVVDGGGVEIRPGNAVYGRWDSLNDGGIMRLANIAGEDTLRHETFHAAMDILPQRLRDAVLKEYGDEEKAADAYGDWKPETKPDSIFSQVRDYFQQLYDKIFRPAQEAFRKVHEGRVWDQATEKFAGARDLRPDFSVKSYPKWEKDFRKTAADMGASQKEIDDHIKTVEPAFNMFRELTDTPPDLPGSNVFDNAWEGKKITFEYQGFCPKNKNFNPTKAAIEKEIGRFLNKQETTGLTLLMHSEALDSPCNYCYTLAGQGAVSENLGNTARKGVWVGGDNIPETSLKLETRPHPDKPGATQSFLPPVDERLLTDEAYRDKQTANDPELAEKVKLQQWYGDKKVYGNLKAPKPTEEGIIPARGALLRMSDEHIAQVNSKRGFRVSGNVDVTPYSYMDVAQDMADARLRGAKRYSYTKQPSYVRLVGNTGEKINMSLTMNPLNTDFITNDWSDSMNFNDAKALRKEFPNAGTMLMAFNDNHILAGLKSPDVDMMVPYHGTRGKFPANIKEFVQDYSRENHETNIKTGETVSGDKEIKQTEHQGDLQTYLRICKERGYLPKFARFIYDNVESNKTANGVSSVHLKVDPETGEPENPVIRKDTSKNFMKLVKDIARTDSPHEPIKRNVDMKHLEEVVNQIKTGNMPWSGQSHDGVTKTAADRLKSGKPLYNGEMGFSYTPKAEVPANKLVQIAPAPAAPAASQPPKPSWAEGVKPLGK